MIHVRVQNTVGREQPLQRLLDLLPPAVEVITDHGEQANPWRGYQKCLTDIPACSHLLVVQDDVIVCRNFMPALEQVAAANPETVVCLFVPGSARQTVAVMAQRLRNRKPYAQVHHATFMPVVATLWPKGKAEAFLRWAHDNPKRLGHQNPRSDDSVAGRWMRLTGQRVLATCPSLVEHPDDVPSSIGLRARAGDDKGRVAAFYIGDSDPLDIDWSLL
jgi:hypothetical protein